MATATAPAASNEAESLLALLDAAKALGSYMTITIWADRYPEHIAEYALRLWATANGATIEEKLEDFGASFVRCIYLGHRELEFPRVSLQCETTPKVEVREPAPGIVITVPLEAVPTVEPINDNTKLDALDDSATRFSLLEID